MRIVLKLVLDCSPDAAWRAVRSPAVFRAVSAPLVAFVSLEPGGFPTSWPAGKHSVRATALGVFAAGTQVIDISFPPRPDDVRVVRDTGGALDGPLAVVTKWRHSMAISAAPDGRTLYRDRLVFEAGLLTLPIWLFYWGFWQWRAFRLKKLAPGWR